MAQKDAAWFSSYFGWGNKPQSGERADTDRAVNGVHAAQRSTDDQITPGLKRIWRAMLGNGDSHPPVGR